MRQNRRNECYEDFMNCTGSHEDRSAERYYLDDYADYENRDKVKCIDGDNVYYIPRQLFARVVMSLEVPERKYVRYKTGAEMYDMSERKFKTLVADARAKIKIGKLVLVDLKKIDKYLSYFYED